MFVNWKLYTVLENVKSFLNTNDNNCISDLPHKFWLMGQLIN